MTTALLDVYLDASVLINFLAVDAVEVLRGLPYRFFVPDEVREEIKNHEQRLRLLRAMPGVLMPASINDSRELELAETLRSGDPPRLGRGEAYAAALAVCRKGAVALDDRAARLKLRRNYPELRVLGTVDLVSHAVEQGSITIDVADAVLDEMEKLARFTVRTRPWWSPQDP